MEVEEKRWEERHTYVGESVAKRPMYTSTTHPLRSHSLPYIIEGVNCVCIGKEFVLQG